MRNPGSEKKCVLRPNTPPAFSKQPQELLLLQSKMDANADKTILERVPSTLRAPQHFFQVPDGSVPFKKKSKSKTAKKNMRSPGSEKKMRFATHLNSECAARSLTSGKGAPQHFFQVPDGSMFFFDFIIFLRFFRFCY